MKVSIAIVLLALVSSVLAVQVDVERAATIAVAGAAAGAAAAAATAAIYWVYRSHPVGALGSPFAHLLSRYSSPSPIVLAPTISTPLTPTATRPLGGESYRIAAHMLAPIDSELPSAATRGGLLVPALCFAIFIVVVVRVMIWCGQQYTAAHNRAETAQRNLAKVVAIATKYKQLYTAEQQRADSAASDLAEMKAAISAKDRAVEELDRGLSENAKEMVKGMNDLFEADRALTRKTESLLKMLTTDTESRGSSDDMPSTS